MCVGGERVNCVHLTFIFSSCSVGWSVVGRMPGTPGLSWPCQPLTGCWLGFKRCVQECWLCFGAGWKTGWVQCGGVGVNRQRCIVLSHILHQLRTVSSPLAHLYKWHVLHRKHKERSISLCQIYTGSQGVKKNNPMWSHMCLWRVLNSWRQTWTNAF